jgi:hypothetical protein
MAKGKNHDRKAQKGFGKVKSSASGGEFNLKKVKGGSVLSFTSCSAPLARHSLSFTVADGSLQARTFTAMRRRLRW